MKSIKELVLKVASRCNLNCSYCYMYNKGDFSYLKQPKFMSDETVDNIIRRVKEHCEKHHLSQIEFAFHGGEPLLAGKTFYQKFVQKCREWLAPSIRVLFSMQTNGVLLDDEWCQLLKELDIYVGISIDGPQHIHDQHRVYHSGKGSFVDVWRGLQILQRYQDTSVISVLNVNSDPLAFYNLAKELPVRRISVLLPDATYDNPEPAMNFDPGNDDAPYADWLIKLYDQWRNDSSDNSPGIPFFQIIVRMILGESHGNEAIGKRVNNALVIQTDGSYEAHDTLKICGDGFTKSDLSVYTHEIDDALDTELADAYYQGHLNLCAQCEACPIGQICGGGFIAHRFSAKNHFNSPSVYCKDLMKLITYIQNDIVDSLPQEIFRETNIRKLTYGEARSLLKSFNQIQNIYS